VNVHRMRVIIRASPEDVAKWVAAYVKTRINTFKPTPERPFVLGLPTGSSPLALYQQLVKMHKKGEISFKHVITFNMDEYVALPRDHPQSYHSFMWENLFKHIDIRPENVNILNGNAEDLDAECKRYEDKIVAVGGIELFLGGIGTDGHIAFNEPASSLKSRTRVKTLAYETVVANARFFDNDIKKVPKKALTVGVQTVMDAREVLIIITGQHKAHALMKCIEEGVNHMYTLSAIQLHPDAIIVCDDDSTGELRVRTVRYFKDLEKVHMTMLGDDYTDIYKDVEISAKLRADEEEHDLARSFEKKKEGTRNGKGEIEGGGSGSSTTTSSSSGSSSKKRKGDEEQGKKSTKDIRTT